MYSYTYIVDIEKRSSFLYIINHIQIGINEESFSLNLFVPMPSCMTHESFILINNIKKV